MFVLSCMYIGLHFRLSNSKEVIHRITYASLPGVRLKPVDWKMCCTSDSDLPGEHIIFYQLTHSVNSLLEVAEECCEDEANVVGLIVVNFEKSCFLPDDILKNGVPQGPPMYVVSVEDGEQLFDFMSAQVSEGDVQVKVLVESSLDADNPRLSRRPSRGMFINIFSGTCILRTPWNHPKCQSALIFQVSLHVKGYFKTIHNPYLLCKFDHKTQMHTLKLGTYKILIKANFGTIFGENLMTDCSYKMRSICGSRNELKLGV